MGPGLGFSACPSPTSRMWGHCLGEETIEALSQIHFGRSFFVCFVFGTPRPPVCSFMDAIPRIGAEGPRPVMNACPSPASRWRGDCLARWGGRQRRSFFCLFYFRGRLCFASAVSRAGLPLGSRVRGVGAG
jgi:hypothetical protein